ncbi:fatty acid desaturase [Porphyrobacter sp. TH134]|uniref:fatty acid desaturase n=1 Tax=Porphyrobacter sp. TH134 TaxID=2067450 RepID=UPI001F1F200B|nr:fatty acid desaturase [Porphyrobacter sp. TH134]
MHRLSLSDQTATLTPAPLEPRKLVADLKPFSNPQAGRSIWELAITVIPFIGIVLAMLAAVQAGYAAALLLTPLAGLFLLRVFIIQHDCGHGAFFVKRAHNDWTGRALGVLTFTPYDCWRRSHTLHHANTGNLDARGFGDVDTLTVEEFRSASRLQRLKYRVYRHPVVLFGIGPAYLFMLQHRLPIGLMKAGSQYWVNAIVTNLATTIVLAGLAFQFGIAATALVIIPTLLIAASTGVWLFYIQHQFEAAHWDKAADWSFHEAALRGSSHLDLPQPLRWFTANIGVHHVHHLVSRIPFYRLSDVLKAYPELREVNRFTLSQTLRPLVLTLWDEQQRKLVSFREAKLQAS